MSKTSLKIKRNIDIHSKRTVFIGNETGEYAKSQINKLPKVDMRRAWQVALGAIPSMGTVKGTETEVIKTYIAQIALGSIPTVVGSSEAFNPSNWKNGDINTLFANSLYGGGISGVHTGAAQVEVEPKNIVLGAVSYVGWVKDKNTGKWKYLNQDGEVQTGWKQIDDKWYYFDNKGCMSTGWRSIDGKIYYFQSKGNMAGSEWVQDKKSKKWYYLRSSGELAVSQMIVTNGNSYYLGKDGAMVTRGEIEWEGKSYYVKSDGICGKIRNIITKKNLIDIGWSEEVITDNMILKLNSAMTEYDITNINSIRHFLAQCSVESGCGEILVERYGRDSSSPEEYFRSRDFKEGNNAPGSPAEKNDGAKYRGAGYIQLTWKENYYKFAKYIGDDDILNQGCIYVSNNYPWESAGWYWSKLKKINNKINENPDFSVEEVTKIVNGGDTALDERKKAYKKCCEKIKE